MKISPSVFISLLKQSFISWQKDKATVWCAALSYFTVFSLGPLLVIIISIVGLIFSKTAIENNVYQDLQTLIGRSGTGMVETVIHHANKPSHGIVEASISTVTLIIGALGILAQLQQMLNAVWGVKQKPKRGILHLIRNRLLNLTMLGVIAFLLLVSLIASASISAFGTFIGKFLPFSPVILTLANFLFSFISISILFAFILKILPDVKITWKNTWVGAIITSLLFTFGQFILGLYITHSSLTSAYGTAASLIVLLLWVYYSAHILFFGAEFTKTYTLQKGEKIIPSEFSVLKHTERDNRDHSQTVNAQKGTTIAQDLARGFTTGVIEELAKQRRRGKKK